MSRKVMMFYLVVSFVPAVLGESLHYYVLAMDYELNLFEKKHCAVPYEETGSAVKISARLPWLYSLTSDSVAPGNVFIAYRTPGDLGGYLYFANSTPVKEVASITVDAMSPGMSRLHVEGTAYTETDSVGISPDAFSLIDQSPSLPDSFFQALTAKVRNSLPPGIHAGGVSSVGIVCRYNLEYNPADSSVWEYLDQIEQEPLEQRAMMRTFREFAFLAIVALEPPTRTVMPKYPSRFSVKGSEVTKFYDIKGRIVPSTKRRDHGLRVFREQILIR